MPAAVDFENGNKPAKPYKFCGMDFPDNTDLNPIEMFRCDMLYSAAKDYAEGYRTLVKISKFPPDVNHWSYNQRQYTLKRVNQWIRTMAEVEYFLLHSTLFKAISYDLDGQKILDGLENHCRKQFGEYPSAERLDEIVEFIKGVRYP